MKMEVSVLLVYLRMNNGNLTLCRHFFLFILERELITPPLNGLILPGITRDSILALAQQWSYKVTEGRITMPEICRLIQEERVY